MSDTGFQHFDAARFDVRSAAKSAKSDNTSPVQPAVSRQPRLPLRAIPARADSGVEKANGTHSAEGSISDGRGRTSGGGDSDGNPLRQACGRDDSSGPNFNIDVPPNGYAWWYVDGISPQTGQAISIIGFIGSVFSPWYRWSGRKSPDNNCCINVATYGKGGRFTMTDRGSAALRQSRDTLEVGPSKMHWNGRELVIDINEIASPPLVSRVRGRVTVTPRAITSVELPLTDDGAHIWRPFAPISDIKVELEATGWQWEGHGYFDSNFGTRALEDDFSYWTWGRYPTADGSVCFYDADRLDGTALEAGVTFDQSGNAQILDCPPKAKMKRSLWQVRRETRADAGYQPRQVQSMLDAPFYSRSAVRTQFNGEETVGVHEALDLTRFRSPLIKPMLAVRVPRRKGWTF
jgi:carotenoid 1,2-hydratase